MPGISTVQFSPRGIHKPQPMATGSPLQTPRPKFQGLYVFDHPNSYGALGYECYLVNNQDPTVYRVWDSQGGKGLTVKTLGTSPLLRTDLTPRLEGFQRMLGNSFGIPSALRTLWDEVRAGFERAPGVSQKAYGTWSALNEAIGQSIPTSLQVLGKRMMVWITPASGNQGLYSPAKPLPLLTPGQVPDAYDPRHRI